jgi:hypothetical protein
MKEDTHVLYIYMYCFFTVKMVRPIRLSVMLYVQFFALSFLDLLIKYNFFAVVNGRRGVRGGAVG